MTAIGQAVPRKEDARLLHGQGTYVDNLTATGTVRAYIVRSPYAHAAITAVDVSGAAKAPGVVAELGEGGDGLVGRTDPAILERSRDHAVTSDPDAARTALTMLW